MLFKVVVPVCCLIAFNQYAVACAPSTDMFDDLLERLCVLKTEDEKPQFLDASRLLEFAAIYGKLIEKYSTYLYSCQFHSLICNWC